jgi:hypothetical protein
MWKGRQKALDLAFEQAPGGVVYSRQRVMMQKLNIWYLQAKTSIMYGLCFAAVRPSHVFINPLQRNNIVSTFSTKRAQCQWPVRSGLPNFLSWPCLASPFSSSNL